MPGQGSKLAAIVGVGAPVVTGCVVVVAHPRLLAVVVGCLLAILGLTLLLLSKRPFLEIHELAQDGARTRLWRLGFEPKIISAEQRSHSGPEAREDASAEPVEAVDADDSNTTRPPAGGM
jgi:hypothetical protein